MTAEEILDKYCEHSSDMFDYPKDIVEYSNAFKAMIEYARHHAGLAFEAGVSFTHGEHSNWNFNIENKSPNQEEYINKTFAND